jgi:hypothetical protein
MFTTEDHAQLEVMEQVSTEQYGQILRTLLVTEHSNRAITVTTAAQGNLYHHNKLDKKNQQKGKKKEMITSNCTFTNIHLKYTLNALG